MSKPADWKETVARTEGLGDARAEATGRADLWMVVRCHSTQCSSIVSLPMGPEVWRDENTIRRALLEHEGSAWMLEGGWRVEPCSVRRTFQKPIVGWTLLCPRCGKALDARNANVVNQLITKVNGNH